MPESMEHNRRGGIISTARLLFPFMLSHHPDCRAFYDDVICVFGVDICVGCALVYPITILTLLTLVFIPWNSGLPWLLFRGDTLMMFGVMLGIPQMVSTLGLRGGYIWHMFEKAALALGVAGVLSGLLALETLLIVRVVLITCTLAAFSALAALRYHKIRGICSTCRWKGDWDGCPGFARINQRRFKKVSGPGDVSGTGEYDVWFLPKFSGILSRRR